MEATFACDKLTKNGKPRFVSPKGNDGSPTGDVQGSIYLPKSSGYAVGSVIVVNVEPANES